MTGSIHIVKFTDPGCGAGSRERKALKLWHELESMHADVGTFEEALETASYYVLSDAIEWRDVRRTVAEIHNMPEMHVNGEPATVLCTVPRCYTCGALNGEQHRPFKRCTYALLKGHTSQAYTLVYGPSRMSEAELRDLPSSERPMTSSEWTALAELAQVAAERAVAERGYPTAWTALREKCLVRASAAKEGRCMP